MPLPSNPTPVVELDRLGLDRENTTATVTTSPSSKSQLRCLFNRQQSFPDIQNAITKIDPELLKGSRARLCPQGSISKPSLPKPDLGPAAAPLTIFYNGNVSVYHLPQDKAETILKFVEEGWFKKSQAPEEHKVSTTRNEWMAHTFQRRMLHRNVSLQRFLEMRKDRSAASFATSAHSTLKANEQVHLHSFNQLELTEKIDERTSGFGHGQVGR